MSKPKMVPLREVLNLLHKEARSARREATTIIEGDEPIGKWDSFRLRHYSDSLRDAADLIRDYYGGYGA